VPGTSQIKRPASRENEHVNRASFAAPRSAQISSSRNLDSDRVRVSGPDAFRAEGIQTAALTDVFAASSPISSVERIQRLFNRYRPSLSSREAEVCARIVFGLSVIGIASDLNIEESTVVSYRRRAYDRLGIATYRELLGLYLETWQAMLLELLRVPPR
jgi:DNA-binding NarL/FixJ family response regulator